MCFFYFRLVAFPTKLRNPKERQKWKHLINRVDEKGKIGHHLKILEYARDTSLMVG